MKIAAIIQARTSSTRLPRKVLKFLPLSGNVTVLEHVIRRVKRADRLNDVIVATTTDAFDNDIVDIARKENVKIFKGEKNNVLSRYYLAAKENALDVIVRITSDCPCVDPEIMDLIVEEHLKKGVDYTSNTIKRTYPRGLDVEVFNFDILKKVYKNAKSAYDKEHVTPYIYKRPNIFSTINVKAPKKITAPDIRITLDTQSDYRLLCDLFNSLYPANNFFNAYDVVKFFKKSKK